MLEDMRTSQEEEFVSLEVCLFMNSDKFLILSRKMRVILCALNDYFCRIMRMLGWKKSFRS